VRFYFVIKKDAMRGGVIIIKLAVLYTPEIGSQENERYYEANR
jgi:hypothetical protein